MNKVWIGALVVLVPSLSFSNTVIDASKQWNSHASSSTTRSSVKETAPTKPVSEKSDTACGCEVLKPQEYLEDSTYAFTGYVDEVSPVKNGKQTVTFDVDEIFKGAPGVEMKVIVEPKNDGCDLKYQKGQSYLVFAKWEWGIIHTTRCMGTKLLDKARKEALGPSERMKEKLYIHLRNACMGRTDTACCLASLKAMRANYHVPEPDGGCPAGSIPNRLRCSGSYTWCISSTDPRVGQ